RHHCRRRREPDRHLVRRLVDRHGGGFDHGLLSGRERGGDIRDHDGGAAAASARADRRRRDDVMSTAVVAAGEDRSLSPKTLTLVAIWAALLTGPLWLPVLLRETPVGGRGVGV